MSGTKKRVRVALVGISPADQVTLRGYLRVLLALDYELVWIPATDTDIHLFIINNDFQSAPSVSKLLEANPNTPVLYVRSQKENDGSMIQNILTLPLKQINLLEKWLLKSVPAIYSNQSSNSSSSSAPSPSTNPFGKTESATPTAKPLSTLSKPSATLEESQDLTGLISVIKQLQKREAGLVELLEQSKVVAIIDKQQQKLWQLSSISKVSGELNLRPYYGEMPKEKFVDSSNWLWQLALHQGEVLTGLIGHNDRHQIRHWAKPLPSSRRDALQVMTAIETAPLAVGEIAERTGVSVSNIQKILASLLFAGNLTDNSYVALKPLDTKQSNTTPTVQTSTQVSPQINTQSSVQQPSHTTQQQTPPPQPQSQPKPQQEEKLGFLSRLRRKLGL